MVVYHITKVLISWKRWMLVSNFSKVSRRWRRMQAAKNLTKFLKSLGPKTPACQMLYRLWFFTLIYLVCNNNLTTFIYVSPDSGSPDWHFDAYHGNSWQPPSAIWKAIGKISRHTETWDIYMRNARLAVHGWSGLSSAWIKLPRATGELLLV